MDQKHNLDREKSLEHERRAEFAWGTGTDDLLDNVMMHSLIIMRLFSI